MGCIASRSLFAGLVAVVTVVSGVAVAAAEPMPAGGDDPAVSHHEALEVRVAEPAESVRPGAGGPELTKRELGGLGVARAGGEAEEPDGAVHLLDAADGTTDDPAASSRYLSEGSDPTTDPVTEVSLTLAASAVAVTATATRVKRTLTSLWSPPSPDPSDITYIRGENRLFVADAEIEEMTGLTTAFSNEPAGVVYDPTSRPASSELSPTSWPRPEGH